MLGGGFCTTLTEKSQDVDKLPLSKAMQVTFVAPRGKENPDGGLQDMLRMPEESLALKIKSYARLVSPKGCRLMNRGHWIVGGTVSITDAMNQGQRATLPALSVALHVTLITVPRGWRKSPDVEEHPCAAMPELSRAEKPERLKEANGMPNVGETRRGTLTE